MHRKAPTSLASFYRFLLSKDLIIVLPISIISFFVPYIQDASVDEVTVCMRKPWEKKGIQFSRMSSFHALSTEVTTWIKWPFLGSWILPPRAHDQHPSSYLAAAYLGAGTALSGPLLCSLVGAAQPQNQAGILSRITES